MTQVNRITGDSENLARLIRDIKNRVDALQNRDTGSIFVSDQMITADPITGVETIFGALPNGTYGLQQFVNDTEPPPIPSTPFVTGDRAVFEISWDGGTVSNDEQPPDYNRTVIEIADSATATTWVEINYFTAAGSVVLANQPYGVEKFFRLVSIDHNGNRSNPSGVASAILVSYMESPEMTSYINEVETAVSTANSNASTAQETAATAAEVAANAEKLAQAASSSATSMVKNGSFEFDFESWTKESVNGSISTSTAFEGTKSWEIGTAGSGIYQTEIPVTVGDIFVYEMHYKTISGYSGSGGLRLQSSTNGTTFATGVNGTCVVNTDWVSQTVEYTVPAGVTHIRPRIAFAGGANMGAWVDSVRLTNVTAMRKLEKTAADAKAIAEQAASDAEDAARDAGTALTSANGKNTVWRQATQPAGTSHKVNDIWFDIDDENKIHLWNGTTWSDSRDGAVGRALSDAADAESAAATAAQAASDAASKASAAETAANTASGQADTASQAAAAASDKADDAFTAANGKNKITPSFVAAPAIYTGVVGDIWWQKNTVPPYEIIKQSTWNGTTWDAETLGNNTISNLNAGKINAGTLAADRIGTNSITAEKMAANTITATSGIIASLNASVITVGELEGARIKAGSLFADRLVVGTGDNLLADPKFTSGSALTTARLAASTAGAVWTTPDYIGWNKTTASNVVHTLKLGGNIANINTPVIPVIPGRRYVVTWGVYVDIATTSTKAVVTWQNRAGTNLPAVQGATIPLTGGNAVASTYRQEFVAPTDAAFATVELQFTSHPGGGWIDFRNPVFQLMTDGTIITKDTITSDHIQAGSIKGDSLDVASVKAKIVTANMFEGDTFTGGTFQQATFQTSPLANTGSKMSPTLGFVSYGADNTPVFSVSPSGVAFFKGSVNITGGSVPMTNVTGLDDKMETLDTTYQIVNSWTDPSDITLINGGRIKTNSIAAEKINLGSGANMIVGGYGDPPEPWPNYTYTDTPIDTGAPGTVGYYRLAANLPGYSSYFSVAGLTGFTFSYKFTPNRDNLSHHVLIHFHSINGSLIETRNYGIQTGVEGFTQSREFTNQVAPVGAVTARVLIVNNASGVAGTGNTAVLSYFFSFRMTTGTETKLTAAGLTSYKDGMQTLRLNGDNNLIIGEFITGRPGIEPYIKMTSTANEGHMQFYGVPGGVANRGSIRWNQGALGNESGGGTWGFLSMYAIDDSKPVNSRDYYAAGIQLVANQRIKFQGKLDGASDMMKAGTVNWTEASAFGPGVTAQYDIVYDRPFPDGTDFGQLSVQLTMVSGNGAPLNAVVVYRDNAKFSYRVRNMSTTLGSGATRMSWMVIRTV